jgi:hypothetical protein
MNQRYFKTLCYSMLGLFSVGSVIADSTPIYGKRFCEIVYSKNFMDFYVYNSNTLHDCPQSWWKGLNQNIIKKDVQASYVFLNGPRIWLVDKIDNEPSKARTVNQFRGKPLHLVGTFHTDFQTLLKHHGPYTDYKIDRDQVCSLHKGRMIIEIINQQGQVYILQSISLKHHMQTPDNIAQLKHQIKLPKGWFMKMGALPEDFKMRPQEHSIHVVQDEFDNTYQLVDKDLIK